MKLHDISLPVQAGMVTWPDHPPVTLQRFCKMEEGARCNVSRLEMGTHAGTHVDAPSDVCIRKMRIGIRSIRRPLMTVPVLPVAAKRQAEEIDRRWCIR